MEKIVRWVCFITSGCIVMLFILALYIATLLPETFSVEEGETLTIAGMPFLSLRKAGGDVAVTGLTLGNSYNAELALGGVLPVKTVRAQIVSRRVVQVCGTPFGIKMFANGAMVVGFTDIYTATGYCNPAKTVGLQMGDVIQSIGGISTKTNEDVREVLQKYKGAPVEVNYVRDGVARTVTMAAVLDAESASWRTGMWVRDSTAGIGTLTYIDPATNTFAGLGHSIHDVDTGSTISLLKGEIVPVEITSVVAGAQGDPGELKGRFLSSVATGTIGVNGETGVYGNVTGGLSGSQVEVALSQEITPGEAEIVTTIDGQTPEHYTVVIEKVAYNSQNTNRNMIIRITDPRLLNTTGGIVQGMSGSPILQNGRLVGAVTHVLVNDPTRGYGIFADNMLQTTDQFNAQKGAA